MFEIDETAKAKKEAIDRARDEMDKFLIEKYNSSRPIYAMRIIENNNTYSRQYGDLFLDAMIELKRLGEEIKNGR